MPQRVKKRKQIKKPKRQAPSKAGLAKKLGITPQALNWHLKNSDGVPAVEDVSGWVDFLAQNGREGSAPEDIRRQIAERRLEILDQNLIESRRKNEEAAGRMLDSTAVASAIRDAVATMFAELDRIFLTEQPPAVKGLDEVKIRERNTRYMTELKTTVREKFEKASKPARQAIRNTRSQSV